MPDNSDLGREGVAAVELAFRRNLGWSFRDQQVDDYGIDAHIEPKRDGAPTGRLIAAQIKGAIRTAQVDPDNVPELVALIEAEKPQLVLNVALPYQDLHIMDACLETGVDYLDTANYEPLDTARFEYSWQWAYQERFKQAGLMALLGSGFDPGVTNVYTALAAKKYLDVVEELDIIDANAGSHGQPFATS